MDCFFKISKSMFSRSYEQQLENVLAKAETRTLFFDSYSDPLPLVNYNDLQLMPMPLCQKSSTTNVYMVPKNIQDLLKKGIVPQVLKMPLSQSTYKEYFATLLCAEDLYIEKWTASRFENVILKLEDAAIYERQLPTRIRNTEAKGNNKKTFVKLDFVFAQPYLLTKDSVFAQPVDNEVKLFKGDIYRIFGSNIVLAAFGDDFHSQHKPTRKYNVIFSLNRHRFKRAYQAIESASDSLFRDFIFPNDLAWRKIYYPGPFFRYNFNLDPAQKSAVAAILSLNSAPPYLIEDSGASLDFTLVILESVLQIYQSKNPNFRILICAHANRNLDELMKILKKEIPFSHMFRANAALRGRTHVPRDLLPSCRYIEDDNCFICPPLDELLKFPLIFSTFASSVQLRDHGVSSGHFSHIFILDASSATEPESLLPIASLANTTTAVVVTGKSRQCSTWVRSDIGRYNGLRMSYFERLRRRLLYNGNNPGFVIVV
ncbi:hypothetical protein ACFE04_028183 [Oxalis oulophora]